MQQKSELIRELEEAKDKIQLDEWVKRIIAHKSVIARILKAVAVEFQDYSIEEIMDMIGPDVHISKVEKNLKLKHSSMGDTRILGDNTEDKVPGEGVNYYDIRFCVYLPEDGKEVPVKLLVNIEAQKKFYQKYHFVTRGIFYGARMISAQLGTEFTHSEYDKIKKVYSIWICMNAPEEIGNSLTEYSIQKRDIIGCLKDTKRHYDKLSVIIICLNEKEPEEEKGLHRFLNILLSENLPVEVKEEKLENDFGIRLTEDLRKGVSEMCNFGDAIEERGIQKGKRMGRCKEQGRIICNMLKSGMKDEEICNIIGCSRKKIDKIRMGLG